MVGELAARRNEARHVVRLGEREPEVAGGVEAVGVGIRALVVADLGQRVVSEDARVHVELGDPVGLGLRDPQVAVVVALDRVAAAVHREDAVLARPRVDPLNARVVVDDAVGAELEVVAAREVGRAAGAVREAVLVDGGAQHVARGRRRDRELRERRVRPEGGEQDGQDEGPRLGMVRRQVNPNAGRLTRK